MQIEKKYSNNKNRLLSVHNFDSIIEKTYKILFYIKCLKIIVKIVNDVETYNYRCQL